MLKKFINSTKIQINTPAPYGALHLAFAILGVILSVLAAKKFKNFNDKRNNTLFFTLGFLLAFGEIYKQLYFFFVIGNGRYIWDAFPFQPCSMAMYICLIIPFIKKPTRRQLLYDFLFIYSTLGGIATYVAPINVLNTHLTITIHSLVWHMILIFIGVYLLYSNRVSFSKGAYKSATKLFLTLCGTAFFINCVVTAITGQEIAMFFLGPQITDIVLIKDICVSFGWLAGSIVSVVAMCLGGYLFYRPFYRKHNK